MLPILISLQSLFLNTYILYNILIHKYLYTLIDLHTPVPSIFIKLFS